MLQNNLAVKRLDVNVSKDLLVIRGSELKNLFKTGDVYLYAIILERV